MYRKPILPRLLEDHTRGQMQTSPMTETHPSTPGPTRLFGMALGLWDESGANAWTPKCSNTMTHHKLRFEAPHLCSPQLVSVDLFPRYLVDLTWKQSCDAKGCKLTCCHTGQSLLSFKLCRFTIRHNYHIIYLIYVLKCFLVFLIICSPFFVQHLEGSPEIKRGNHVAWQVKRRSTGSVSICCMLQLDPTLPCQNWGVRKMWPTSLGIAEKRQACKRITKATNSSGCLPCQRSPPAFGPSDMRTRQIFNVTATPQSLHCTKQGRFGSIFGNIVQPRGGTLFRPGWDPAHHVESGSSIELCFFL